MELTQSRSGKGCPERVMAKLRAGAGEGNQVNGVECEILQRGEGACAKALWQDKA